MIRPPFHLLSQSYPNTKPEVLLADIGWNDLIGKKAYEDTCAIRLSYALLLAGVHLPGARMQAKAGKINGRYIEPGQAKLSNILKGIWGAPEVYASEASAEAGIGKRSGVVSFFRIRGGNGGHIDLIWTQYSFQNCARHCYFTAATIWFWPLK